MANSPRSKSADGTETKDETGRDAHTFERVAGPGPNDAGKGAAGREAIERLAGAPEVRPEGRDADDAEDDEN